MPDKEGRSQNPEGVFPEKSQSIIEDDNAAYGYAAAEVAAANTSQPWNVASALAHDAYTYIVSGRPGRHASQPEVTATQATADDAVSKSVEAAGGVVLQEGIDIHAILDEGSKPGGLPRTDSIPSTLTEESIGPGSSADMEGTGISAAHYDPGRDVTLRLEFLTTRQTRFVILFMWTSLFIGMTFLWIEFGLKVKDPDGSAQSRDQHIMNLTAGSICFCIMCVSMGRFCRRVFLSLKHNMIWKPRRRKATSLVHFELLVQFLNILTFLAVNANAITSRCKFFSKADRRPSCNPSQMQFSGLVGTRQGTVQPDLAYLAAMMLVFVIFLLHCIAARNVNIWRKRFIGSSESEMGSSSHGSLDSSIPEKSAKAMEPALYMEAPLWVHWPVGIVWLALESAIVALHVLYGTGAGNLPSSGAFRPPGVAVGDCKHYTYNCAIKPLQSGVNGIALFFPFLYFCIFCVYLRQAFLRLRKEPYADFKIGNLLVRLMVRLRLAGFAFFIVSIVLLYLVKHKSCRGYVDTWLGLLPLHVAETGSAVCWSFLHMPKSPLSKPPMLQVWLQEFAWTEKDMPKSMRTRNAAQTSGTSEYVADLRARLAQEPMFCFQTAMNMWYWSALVYDYKQAKKPLLSLEEGMRLYGLTESELFWEKASDTKMLMAWNRNTVVVAFRGTASINNAWSDMQAYPTVHHPKRGSFFSRPRVHSGFQKCWMCNDFSNTIQSRLQALLDSGELELGDVKFYVTGHSLGGALATLAAIAFCKAAKEAQSVSEPLPVACYTFGAPRTGNHTFAREYEHYVPDTWNLINDQDAVPRSGKFFGLFKRGGHRVIINAHGDMLVRPLSIEASLRQVPGGMSVSQHLLAAYTVSLLAIQVSQFTSKRFKGGMAGVVRLAEQSPLVRRMLEEREGWSLEDMRHMLQWGPSHAGKIKRRLFMRSSSDTRQLGSLARSSLVGMFKGPPKKGQGLPGDEESVPTDATSGSVLDIDANEQQDLPLTMAQAAKMQL